MNYDEFVKHQLSEHQGLHIMERPMILIHLLYSSDASQIGNCVANYHYTVSNSLDTKIERFGALSNYLRDKFQNIKNDI